MNLFKEGSTKTIATSTAFRLPISLLQMVDRWCAKNDITRSQFVRHSITERVKTLGIECVEQKPEEEERRWSPELYDRLQRRR